MRKVKSAIYKRPADGATSSSYPGDARIDPMDIYGFPKLAAGEEPIVTDHPEFPNPRRSPLDRDLIEEIKAAGVLLEPIVIYWHEDAETDEEVAVLVNGKTRLTAVAEAWAEDPETDKFRLIPYSVVNGTPLEISFLQAKLNLDEARRPLSVVETADFLARMEREHGLDEERQLELLKKPVNVGTLRWLREVKAVAGDPTVRKPLESGDIDLPTAKAIERLEDDEARRQAVVAAKEAQEQGLKGRQLRQTVKSGDGTPIRAGNRTTLGVKETVRRLGENYAEMKLAFQRDVDPSTVNPAFRGEWEDMIADCELMAMFRAYAVFLKIDHLELGRQFADVEALLGPEECQALRIVDWMPDAIEEAKDEAVAKPPSSPKSRRPRKKA